MLCAERGEQVRNVERPCRISEMRERKKGRGRDRAVEFVGRRGYYRTGVRLLSEHGDLERNEGDGRELGGSRRNRVLMDGDNRFRGPWAATTC